MDNIDQIPQLLARPTKSWRQYLLESLLAVGGSLAITGVVYIFHLYPTIPNISIIYLLLIMVLASTRGRYAAVVAVIVAFLSFDFFLVPPLYTFSIARWEEWLALIVFLITALLTSQLAATTRHSVEQAREREREARILYEVGRVLNRTDRLDEQLDTIALALVRVFSPWGVRECALLIPDEYGTLSMRADAPIRVEQFTLTPAEWAAAREVMAQGKVRDIYPEPSASARQQTVLRLVPLKAATHILGVLCLRIEQRASWLASPQHMQETQDQPTDQAIFFWTFVDEAVIKIEHARLRGEAASGKE
jgi:K+-sensing histidine kinase KdpD